MEIDYIDVIELSLVSAKYTTATSEAAPIN